MRRIALALAAPFVFILSTARGQVVVLDPPVQGDDIGKIISILKAGGGRTKGEFETTAEFMARSNSIPANLRSEMVFPVVVVPGQNNIFYNADRGKMSVSLIPDFHYPAGSTLALHRVIKNLPPYEASNALGAKRLISRSYISEQGIRIRDANLIGLSFAMERGEAQELKPFLCIAVAGTINKSVVEVTSSRHAPLMTEPNDTTTEGEYVSVALDRVVVIDKRNGHIVATIALNRPNRP